MKKVLLTLLLPALTFAGVYAQSHAAKTQRTTASGNEQILTFRFVPGEDMFYIPWEGNNVQLDALYTIVDRYRSDIASGAIPVYVDSYSSSMREGSRNRQLAFIRANRVKSELITHKGLVEDNFITKNYTTAYTAADGTTHKDMVVVTLRIPAPTQPQPRPERTPEPQPQPQSEPAPVVEQTPAPVPAPEPRIVPQPDGAPVPYRFAIRTNLLYDAFLLPTLGAEWRVNRNVGIKLDGSYSRWGDEHGKVQKIWLISPEVRWYVLENKRFYLGASGNVGKYNIYKGVLGGLISDDTGYQGKLWGAGLTVGYQLYLSRGFSLDFNLGLGYTRLEYDSFTISRQTRVYKDRDKTRNFWGPTQAGISLVWTIGGDK